MRLCGCADNDESKAQAQDDDDGNAQAQDDDDGNAQAQDDEQLSSARVHDVVVVAELS